MALDALISKNLKVDTDNEWIIKAISWKPTGSNINNFTTYWVIVIAREMNEQNKMSFEEAVTNHVFDLRMQDMWSFQDFMKNRDDPKDLDINGLLIKLVPFIKDTISESFQHWDLTFDTQLKFRITEPQDVFNIITSADYDPARFYNKYVDLHYSKADVVVSGKKRGNAFESLVQLYGSCHRDGLGYTTECIEPVSTAVNMKVTALLDIPDQLRTHRSANEVSYWFPLNRAEYSFETDTVIEMGQKGYDFVSV